MGIRALYAGYGRESAGALRAEIAAAKRDEALATVTVIVPSNQVGVSARRLLASGEVGAVCGAGVGLAAVSFLTAYRLAELLGAPALAGAGRRPISTPVLTAAVRGALGKDPGMFAPVAAHPATEGALVVAYRELRDASPAALDAIAATSRRAADVVRLHRSTRGRLEPEWYDEQDLLTAAVEVLSSRSVKQMLGRVVVYLPQRLSRHAATLLTAVSRHTDVSVVAGTTGDPRADAEVEASLGRLGVEAGSLTRPTPDPIVSTERTRIVTASDADAEVREAVRAVIEAVRSGTPLDRIAILHASPEPYDRLIRDHLSAADVPTNGATAVPVSARLAGRTLVQLLDLPSLGFRRQDVFAWLAAAPVLHRGRPAPVAAWERLSREAGVVGGREHWDRFLEALAVQRDEFAAEAEADPDQPSWRAEGWQRDAARARDLRAFVLDLIDQLDQAAAAPARWSGRAQFARDRLHAVLGGRGRRDRWPAVERTAAERVELALDRLAALDAVEAAVDLDVFSRSLAIELESDLGRVGRFGEGVLVGSIGMGVGLDLDLVILLGLAEGTFPAPVRDDSLLPDAEKEAAGGELALRSQRIEREHRQFLATLAGAERHVLGIPRGDLRRSSERVPSRWALDVASTLSGHRWWTDDLFNAEVEWVDQVASFDAGIRRMSFPATAQEHRLRSFLAAAPSRAGLAALAESTDYATATGIVMLDARRSATFTRFDGNLAGLAIPSPVDGLTSATSLQRWAGCPRAYLVQTLLKAEPVENPEEELQITPLVRGSLVHEVLEAFLEEILQRPRSRQPAPNERWPSADRELLRTIGERICDSYEHNGLTGRAIFWRQDRKNILNDLDRFLDSDDLHRARAGARPIATELPFGMREGMGPVLFPLPDGRLLPVRGKADRVDVADDGTLHVIDYKTGQSKWYRSLSETNPDQQGARLQLPVYALAARQHQHTPEAPVHAVYWFASAAGQFAQVGYRVTAAVLEQVGRTLDTIVGGIEAGVFPAHPPEPSTSPRIECWFCDPDGLGTSELRRQWDDMADDRTLGLYLGLVNGEASLGDEAEP